MPESSYLMRRAVRGAKRYMDRLSVHHYPDYNSDLRGFKRPQEAATREIARADILARKNSLIRLVGFIDALFGAYEILRGIQDREVPAEYLNAIQKRLCRVAARGKWLGEDFESYNTLALYFAKVIIPALKKEAA